MRQPQILLNLMFSAGALQRLGSLLPTLCFGNLFTNNAVLAFGSTVFRQVRFGGKVTIYLSGSKIHGLVCRAAWEFLFSAVGQPRNLI